MLRKSSPPREKASVVQLDLDRQLTVAKDSLEYSNNILDTLREPFLVLNEDLEVVSAAKVFYSTFKVLPEETIGNLIYNLGNGQWNIPSLKKLLEDILQNNSLIINFRVKHNFETIGQRTMLLNARQIYQMDKDGQMILLAIEDITERSHSQQLIQRALGYAQNIIDTVREPLIMLNSELRVISANRSFYQSYVVKPDETEGQLIFHLGNHQWDIPKLRELLEQILPRDNSFNDFEIEHNFETIGQRTMLLNARRIYRETKESPMILLAIEDITERKQIETKLTESHSMRELLLDIITHDLKNPAGVIYGMSEMARKSLPENKLIENIYLSSERLLQVLDTTTVLAQGVFGEMIPLKELNLYELLTGVVDLFERSLQEAKLDLKINIDKNLIVIANPVIAEVFKNYISNAIRYAASGKTIEVEAIIEDESVLISVKDCGMTIPEEMRLYVFKRQTQLAKKTQGRGLGLAIVKRIAAAHHGNVWVEPNLPRGNSFCLRLPH